MTECKIPNLNNEESDDTEKISKVISMLQLDKKKRGQEDLDILIHMLSKTKFFQERNLSEKLVNMLVYDMKYQFVPQDQIIFEFGSSGSLFYFILEGKVSVRIPMKSPLESGYTSPANSPKRAGNISIADEFMLAASDRKFKRQSIKQHRASCLFGSFPMNTNELNYEEVAELDKGANFGELALITDKARLVEIRNIFRSARMVALVDTHLAVLSKSSFGKMLKYKEQQKLGHLTRFFESTPYFANCKERTLHKLQYYFTRKHIIKNQVIYKSGDIPQNVYLALEGEFEMKVRIQKKELSKKLQKSKTELFLNKMRVRIGAHGLGRALGSIEKQYLKGEKIELKTIGRGQFMGEEDLLNKRPHLATVTCKSVNGTVLQISKEDFEKWILSIPEVEEYFVYYTGLKDEIVSERIEEFRRKEGEKSKKCRKGKRGLYKKKSMIFPEERHLNSEEEKRERRWKSNYEIFPLEGRYGIGRKRMEREGCSSRVIESSNTKWRYIASANREAAPQTESLIISDIISRSREPGRINTVNNQMGHHREKSDIGNCILNKRKEEVPLSIGHSNRSTTSKRNRNIYKFPLIGPRDENLCRLKQQKNSSISCFNLKVGNNSQEEGLITYKENNSQHSLYMSTINHNLHNYRSPAKLKSRTLSNINNLTFNPNNNNYNLQISSNTPIPLSNTMQTPNLLKGFNSHSKTSFNNIRLKSKGFMPQAFAALYANTITNYNKPKFI